RPVRLPSIHARRGSPAEVRSNLLHDFLGYLGETIRAPQVQSSHSSEDVLERTLFENDGYQLEAYVLCTTPLDPAPTGIQRGVGGQDDHVGVRGEPIRDDGVDRLTGPVFFGVHPDGQTEGGQPVGELLCELSIGCVEAEEDARVGHEPESYHRTASSSCGI